jgi:hypothetical protein
VIKIIDDKTYVQVEEQQPRREELVVPETSKRKKLKTLTEKKKQDLANPTVYWELVVVGQEM